MFSINFYNFIAFVYLVSWKIAYICGVKNISKFKRSLIWLRRIGHSRGFGVQSPWAYRFVRYVINEHWMYYAYSTLESKFPDLSVVERKLCELYFRLANFSQPSVVVAVCQQEGLGTAHEAYFNAGCHLCKYRQMDDFTALYAFLNDGRRREGSLILYVGQDCTETGAVSKCIAKLRDGDFVIVEGIGEKPDTAAAWNEMKGVERGGLLFDLHYAGLMYVDSKRYRQYYIINF